MANTILVLPASIASSMGSPVNLARRNGAHPAMALVEQQRARRVDALEHAVMLRFREPGADAATQPLGPGQPGVAQTFEPGPLPLAVPMREAGRKDGQR